MDYTKPIQELLSELNTGEKGLSSEEVKARQEQYGPNALAQGQKKTMLQRFLDQFKDAMILILLAAAAISFITACVEGHGFFEPLF